MNKPLEIKIGRTEDIGFRTDFKTYTQSALSINEVHQLANKEDVEAIINGICQNYGLSFTLDADFVDLLTLIVKEKTNWFSEWDNIINLL